MGNVVAAQENWEGLTFANGWTIQKKINCSTYRAIYKEATGEDKIIKNAHYLCHNTECGVDSYLERTVIQRAINSGTQILSKCKGCVNGNKKDGCHYSIKVREKNLTKTPDRSSKIQVGKTYGAFIVKQIFPSGNSLNHKQTAEVVCVICGNSKTTNVNDILACNVACECFKHHSTGETLIKNYLDKHNFSYQTEMSFDGLYGIGGGALRYDFAIFKDKELKCLIEFDGEQHFQEAGAYFNKDGHVQIHDDRKNQYAIKHNIPLLRISFTDINKLNEILDDWLKNFI